MLVLVGRPLHELSNNSAVRRMLFGQHTESLQRALALWDAGDTRKYKIVGNLVAQVSANAVGELINRQLLHQI